MPGVRFDYVNAGLPGYHMRAIGPLFDACVARLAPDVVVLWPSGDANADCAYEARRTAGYDGVHFRAGRLARYSHTWARAEREVIAWWRLARMVPMTPRLRPDAARLAADFAGRLENLMTRWRTTAPLVVLAAADGRMRRGQTRLQLLRGAKTAAFHMPHMAIPDMLDVHDAYQGAMQAVAARTATPFLDLTGRIPPDRAHYFDTFHFADAGAAMMGRLVAERLAAEPTLVALARAARG
jgi:hypothetical protein